MKSGEGNSQRIVFLKSEISGTGMLRRTLVTLVVNGTANTLRRPSKKGVGPNQGKKGSHSPIYRQNWTGKGEWVKEGGEIKKEVCSVSSYGNRKEGYMLTKYDTLVSAGIARD